MFKLLIFFLILYTTTLACRREPSVYHSRVGKQRGDNSYRIKLQDDLKKYVPGEVYTGNYNLTFLFHLVIYRTYRLLTWIKNL